MCGDGRCNGNEDCGSCPGDCGSCPPCNYAPTCDDAAGAPAAPTPRPDLCVGVPATSGAPAAPGSGPMNCGPAQLRMRVEKIRADGAGGVAYCIIAATDGANDEVALTTRTRALSGGDEYFFDPSVGLFWGQKDLRATTSAVQVQYKCFLVQSDGWAAALQAAGKAAAGAAGYAGQYGWAFDLGAVAANVLGAALQAAAGDKLQLDVTQTLPTEDLLDLANGRYFTVQQSKNGGDWTLFVETWGCAVGTPPK